MADTKTTALTANTAPADTDIVPMVDDPGGTPLTQKSTLLTLKTFVQASLGARTSSSSSSANTATSTSVVSVVASATPHTKGAYVELIASTAHDTETLTLTFHGGVFTDTVNTNTLLDIAVGAAASEVDLITNLAVGGLGPRVTYVIPIHIAAGARVSARIQSVVVSKSITLSAGFRSHGDNQAVPTACTPYGVSTATSGGVTLTTAGTIHVKSAYTEIVASTSADLTRLFVAVHSSQTASVAATGLIDIATGAAASETVVIPNLFYELTTTELIYPGPSVMAFTVAIPSGTRLAARYQANSNAAGGAPKIALYGLL